MSSTLSSYSSNQQGAISGNNQKQNLQDEKTVKAGFICNLEVGSDIPDIPIGPRFLNIPFDSAGLSEFLPESSVYTDYRWPVHYSLKQVDIPIIGYDKYSQMGSAKSGMDPEDELLFVDIDEGGKPTISESSNSWLRFMEYGDSSTLAKRDMTDVKQPEQPAEEEKKKKILATKEERIEDSFKPAILTRPDNPDVVAEAVWEVLPDELCSCYDYGLVHFEGDMKDENESVINTYLRFHQSGGVDFCEHLEPVPGATQGNAYRNDGDEDSNEKEDLLEWQRSFVSSQIHPIPGAPSKEMYALVWDPTSQGGIVKYVPLSDNYVYSLTGHKKTNAAENIGIVVEEEQIRDKDDFEMFNVADDSYVC